MGVDPLYSNYTWIGRLAGIHSPINHISNLKTRYAGLTTGEDLILLCFLLLTQY